MDRTELERMLRSLDEELEQVELQFRELEVRRESLRQAVFGIRGLLGSDSPEPETDRGAGSRAPLALGPPASGPATPRGKQAVRLIFEEYPNRAFGASDMLVELRKRGWEPHSEDPEGVLRTTIRRLMRDDSRIIRVAHGVYALREPSADEPRREGLL